MNAVLGGLASGHTQEQKARLARALKDEHRVIGVAVPRSDLPSQKVRPELGKPVRVYGVEGYFVYLEWY